MALMKKYKQGSSREAAVRAREEGRTVLMIRYWDDVMNFQGTGSISGAAEAIESIEGEGWRLADLSYTWVSEKDAASWPRGREESPA